jgi:hypothetical protein
MRPVSDLDGCYHLWMPFIQLILHFLVYSGQGPKPKLQASGKNMLNLASTNFLGYISNEEIKVNL